MFCTKCGKEVKEGSKFCTGCGAPMTVKSDLHIAEPVVEKVAEKVEARPNKKVPTPKASKKKTGLPVPAIVGLILAGLLFVGALAFGTNYVLNNILDKASEDTDEDYEDDKDTVKEDKDATKEEPAAEPAVEPEQEPQETADVDKEALLKTYADENVGDYSKEYSVYIERSDNEYYVSDLSGIPVGYVDKVIRDFDDDGDPELLMFKATFDDEHSSFNLEMYEVVDGEVKLQANEESAVGFMYLSPFAEGTSEIYLVGNEIVFEDSYLSWLLADGVIMSFHYIAYDGEAFQYRGGVDYSGSDGMIDEKYVETVRRFGAKDAEWSEMLSRRRHIHSYLDDYEGILTLQFVHNVGSEEINKWKEGNMERYPLSTVKFIKGVDDSDSNRMKEYYDAYYETQYILPDSSERLITEDDLEGFDKEQCRMARNELYARHGRIFEDEEIQAYFESKDWYFGMYTKDEFDENLLFSDIEIANRDTIVKYEKEHGYR